MTETMPHQALYRRWRAQTFGQIVGQEAVVATLRNAVRTGRVAHAVLFVGPRGTGKTSLARILAKALNCTDLRDGEPCDACGACVAVREGTTLDLVEIDAASTRGIDDIRALRERLAYPPGELRRKVYILDEAHQITRDAWNALLKSLEEPPEFVVFIFASTEPSGFPPAILSRLQRFDIRRLTVSEIEGKLRMILTSDGRAADDEAIRLIARHAAGGMRDAETMLDQLLASGGEVLDAEQVRHLLGLAEGEAVERFADALVRGDAAAGLAILDDLEDRGRDMRALLDQVVEDLRAAIGARLADPTGEPSLPELAAVATRLAAIDPTRTGPGGIRLQLELALLAGPAVGPAVGTKRTMATHRAAAHRPMGEAPTPTSGPRSTVLSTPPASAPSEPPAAAGPTDPVPPPSIRPRTPTPTVPIASSEAPAQATPTTSSEPSAPMPATSPAEPSIPTEPSPGTLASPAPPAVADRARPPERDDAAALAALVDGWPEIVAYISQHPPAKPLISACRPIAVEGPTVTLGFAEGQAFLRDAAERRRTTLEEGIGRFLGRPVAVRCVATNVDALAPLPIDDDGAVLVAEARRIFGDDLVDVADVG